MCLVSYIRTLYSGLGHLQGHVFQSGLEIGNYYDLKGKEIDINFASLVFDMDLLHSGRISALHSVVADSISSGEDRGRNSCLVVPYVTRRCLLDFLVKVIQFTL